MDEEIFDKGLTPEQLQILLAGNIGMRIKIWLILILLSDESGNVTVGLQEIQEHLNDGHTVRQIKAAFDALRVHGLLKTVGQEPRLAGKQGRGGSRWIYNVWGTYKPHHRGYSRRKEYLKGLDQYLLAIGEGSP